MKKYILFFFLPVLLIGLHACDEGRIYENAVVATGEGRTVKMTGRISGVDKWSGDYSVVVAGFDDESDYAIVSKVVPASESDNDEIQLTMSGITDEVTTVELCVINKLRGAGIFLGAVWANASWGRYWAWDPKEVWALITFMVYGAAFHARSLRIFRSPLFFHIYMIVAFLTVLMTYFGVNYILGGMHSYANA